MCSRGGLIDGLDCPICWEEFDGMDHPPHVLWCGHTLCKSCVMNLQWAAVKLPALPLHVPPFVACPWCQSLSCRLVWGGKLKCPCKNFTLMWILESAGGESREPESNGHQSPNVVQIHHSSPNTQKLLAVPPREEGVNSTTGLFPWMLTKLALLFLLLTLLLYVLPFCTMVLALYFVATLTIAFPSCLVISLALPSLDWLVRQIAT